MKFPDYLIGLEHVRKEIQDTEDLIWSDVLVLSALAYLERSSDVGLFTSKEVIAILKLDRSWVYRSLKKLQQKGLVNVMKTQSSWSANYISISGFGWVVLKRLQRRMRRLSKPAIDPFHQFQSSS